MSVPDQVLFVVIAPKTEFDRERLAHELRKLLLEDPTLRIDSDLQTGRPWKGPTPL